MKKIILCFAAIIVAAIAMATGTFTITPANPLTPNPSQGPITFVFTNQYTNVITFPVPYPSTVTPALTVASSVTNQFTNVVTSTNFTFSMNPDAAYTNGSLTYMVTYPYQRIQYGTVISIAATPTNVIFAIPYVAPPIVLVAGSVTNNVTDVESVTATGFTLRCSNLNTNQWESIGQCGSYGPNVPNY